MVFFFVSMSNACLLPLVSYLVIEITRGSIILLETTGNNYSILTFFNFDGCTSDLGISLSGFTFDEQ
jgi:hypothetical protein